MKKAKPAAIAAIWKRYGTAKTERKRTELRNQLAEHYLPLVERLTETVGSRLPAHIDLDELRSAGHEALLKTIPKFDPARGFQPGTYLTPRIRGAMLDYLRSVDPVSRTVRRRLPQVAELRDELGTEPTDNEIAERLGITPASARKYRVVPWTDSLSRVISRDGERETSVCSRLALDTDTSRDNLEAVEDALKGCSSIERKLLPRYYLDGRTMSQIGRELKLSESRVSQIHSAILARFQARRRRPTAMIAA